MCNTFSEEICAFTLLMIGLAFPLHAEDGKVPHKGPKLRISELKELVGAVLKAIVARDLQALRSHQATSAQRDKLVARAEQAQMKFLLKYLRVMQADSNK